MGQNRISPKCTGVKPDGAPCHNPAAGGTPFCCHHQPTAEKPPGTVGAHPGCSGSSRHGIYVRGLRAYEKKEWDSVKLGDIDSEIRMAKFRLARVYEAQLMWEDAKLEAEKEAQLEISGSEKELTTATTPGGAHYGVMKKRIARRARDFTNEIVQFSRLIALLERSRLMMIQMNKSDGYYERVQHEMQQFTEEAMAQMPGGAF